MIKKIGILGAGQLARMLALAGYPLGCEFIFFDPNPESCAKHLGQFICADYSDEAQLQLFCHAADVITFENENIDLACLDFVAQHKPLFPGQAILKATQDRLTEKEMFRSLNIATADFFQIDSQDDLTAAAEHLGFPFIIKTRRMGYDGKGQTKIKSANDLKKFELPPNKEGYIGEAFVNFNREVSIIATRNQQGNTVFYDLCENEHVDGILAITKNCLKDAEQEQAEELMTKVLNKFNYVGTLVIEFFDYDGKLIANELAPRVHNSGHWTIEGAMTSQFENHLRALLNLPLGVTNSITKVEMRNLVGEIPNKKSLLKQPRLHCHDYGKTPRAKRKVGHTTRLLLNDQ